MAASFHDDLLDNGIKFLKDFCDRITVCEGEPETFNEANVSKMLATTDLAGSDWTLAAGDVSGRKVTHDPIENVEILTSGDANHLAYLDVSESMLIMVKPITTRAVTEEDFMTIPASKLESRTPSLILT
jgi:hypothetical protein